MKTAFILFFIILLYSVTAKTQTTFNKLNVKDLNVNGNIQVVSTTEASTPCPEMTEAQRDAIASPILGNCVTNSDTLALNVYNGTIWKAAGGGGVNQWITSTGYNIDDVVIESLKFYVALNAHTSGTFATDLAALEWAEVSPYVDTDTIGVNLKPQDGSSVTVQEIQVPNNSSTNTDANKYLIETGNEDILANPSFEHSTFSTSWTNSAGTFTQETSVVIDGKASAKLVLAAQTMSLTQSSSLYAAQFADGVQGLAMVRIKSDIALSVCSIQAGTVSTTNCVTTRTDSKWGLYKIPFILGATSNGISIASSGAVTGTVYIDDAFIGAVDLKQDINVVGAWVTFTPTGSWSTNTTYTGKYRQVGESMEFNVGITVSGAPTSANLEINIPNSWTIDSSKLSLGLTKTSVAEKCMVYDLAPEIYDCMAYAATTTTIAVQRKGAASTYVIDSGAVNATTPMVFASGDTVQISFTVPLTHLSGASSVYTAQNADTDWSSCGHTTSDFTGFGTVTAIETQCKRDGGDLLMKGKFSTGTHTATEVRLALKHNGTALTSAGVTKIPSIQLAGDAVDTIFATTFFRMSALVEPSVSYITFGSQTSASPAITKVVGNNLTSTQTISFNARIPINGWENSNVIIGTFNEVVTSPGISKPKTCHYAFGGASATLVAPTECTSGTCVEVFDSCGTGSPGTRAGAGDYADFLFASGTWATSSYIQCICTAYDTTTATFRACAPIFATSDNSWATNSSGGYTSNIQVFSATDVGSDAYVHLTCTSQAP
jgi:hypothetical protein